MGDIESILSDPIPCRQQKMQLAAQPPTKKGGKVSSLAAALSLGCL